MRARLYGSIALLAAVAAIGIVATERTQGSCTVLCAWQAGLAVLALGAVFGLVALSAVAAGYEALRLLRRRRTGV